MASSNYSSFGFADQITNQKYATIWQRIAGYGVAGSSLEDLCIPLLTDLSEPNPHSPTIKGRDFVHVKSAKLETSSIGVYVALAGDE